MATLDLRPLTQETIDQIGLEKHDLWLVKIGDDTFGPFETESLKQYSSENQLQFDEALATRMDKEEFLPFWENPLFQRRQLQAVSGKHEGPFWLIDNGLIQGPFSFNDIDKKLEAGLLVMTDHVSIDEGESWKKICEYQGFDRRSHSAEELPILPTEEVFDIGKISLVEKVENVQNNTVDQLADLAHVGAQEAKVIQFKAEDSVAKTALNHDSGATFKWAAPAAAVFVLTLATSGFFLMNNSDEMSSIVAETETVEPHYKKPKVRVPRSVPRGVMPTAGERQRMPASAGYAQEPIRESHQESRYPTHVEMHEQQRPYEELLPERDSEQPMAAEAEQRQPEEHSLVAGNGNGQSLPEENSLDAAMNGTEQQIIEANEKAIVEEASDF